MRITHFKFSRICLGARATQRARSARWISSIYTTRYVFHHNICYLFNTQ